MASSETNKTESDDTGRSTAEGRRLATKTLENEVQNRRLTVEGEIPGWLEGSLLRTGPAKFEAGERSLRHWFDGLAMLHAFAVADGEVKYSNRYLESNAYTHVESEGELGYSEFATDPCRDLFERFFSRFSPNLTDNANVNISKQAEAFVSMTETPMPVEFDPETLETVGVAEYEDDIDGSLTTAHPHHDDGYTYNYVTKLSKTSTYKVYRMPDGSREREILASIDRDRPAYMHSFGLTENHVVLAEFPFVVNPLEMLVRDRPFVENYRWKPERGTRFLLVDRETGDVVADPVAEPFFAFHHVNAFEEEDGTVVVDIVAYEDASVIDSFYLDEIRSEDFGIEGGTLRRYRVSDDGVESERLSEVPTELPRINYERNTLAYRYAYGVGNRRKRPKDLPNRLVKVDVEERDTTVWEEPETYPGEPVFVAEPDAEEEEDDGVILSVVLDTDAERSFLVVLDASDFTELGRATVEHHIPLGFHGQFYDV
ncbi:MAG: carotenoid oxygenase family protein [Halobacteriales archaeon]|nr:carotenoid oxygenase family protein [Halobacteriales archaeon]